MNQLFVVVLALFTTGGPATTSKPVESVELCQAIVVDTPSYIGEKVPGPGGELVTILDAQSKCIIFTQQKQASN